VRFNRLRRGLSEVAETLQFPTIIITGIGAYGLGMGIEAGHRCSRVFWFCDCFCRVDD
jgi:hypothetical protein